MLGGFLFALGIIVGVTIVVVFNILCDKKMKQRAYSTDWGVHSPETGQFEWVNEEAFYVFTGKEMGGEIEESEESKKFCGVWSIEGEHIDSINDTGEFKVNEKET